MGHRILALTGNLLDNKNIPKMINDKLKNQVSTNKSYSKLLMLEIH